PPRRWPDWPASPRAVSPRSAAPRTGRADGPGPHGQAGSSYPPLASHLLAGLSKGSGGGSQPRVHRTSQSGDDRIDRLGRLGIAQRATSILHPQPEGKTFFLIFQSLTAIFVEQLDVLHDLRGR